MRRLSYVVLLAVQISIFSAPATAQLNDAYPIIQGNVDEGNVTEAIRVYRSTIAGSAFINASIDEQENFQFISVNAILNALNGRESPDLGGEELQRHITEASQVKDLWLGYINWYQDSVANGQRPRNVRVKAATGFLGNSILLTRNYIDLFETYSSIDVRCLGINAITLWKAWIYRCPDWRNVDPTRYPVIRKNKIRNGNCLEYWRFYADTISEWCENEHLTQANRSRFNRESRDIYFWLKYVE